MYLRSLVLVLVFCGCGGAAEIHESSKPLVQSKNTPARQWKLSGEPSEVYVSESLSHKDFRIEVVPLAPAPGSELSGDESKDWYLVRVNGGEKEALDAKVFLAKWRPFYRAFAYTANIKGAPRKLLYLNKRHGEKWEYQVGRGPSWQLVVEAEAPEVGEELLQGYYEQVDSGMQEKLAPSTREGRERAQDAELGPTRAELRGACGLSTLTIDWSTAEEGLMNEQSLSDVCHAHVRTIVGFCKSYPNVKTRLEAISKVRCDFSRYSISEERELIVDGNELVYYVAPRQVTSDDITLGTLRTSFGESDQVFKGAKSTLILRHGGEGMTAYFESDKGFYPIGASDGSKQIAIAGGIRRGSIYRTEDVWSLQCDDETIPLTRVTGENRDRLIAKATFEKEAKWKREPYFLARDTRGVYYYVDRYQKEFGGRHYRVFVGNRGMLKLTKLKGLVEDTEGTVFSTQKGELRLIVNPKASATWIRGKKKTELTAVDQNENRELIYDELGVYLGENLGHVCDE